MLKMFRTYAGVRRRQKYDKGPTYNAEKSNENKGDKVGRSKRLVSWWRRRRRF